MKNNYFILIILLACCTGIGRAQEKRNLLAGAVSISQLQQQLLSGTKWVQFPPYGNRQEWERIPAIYIKNWIAEGEKLLTYKWQVVPASAYQEFVISGNRDIMQVPYNQNTAALRKLVLAELVEGKGRFIPQMMDGVWALCEMSSWVLSAHLYMQKPGAGLPDVQEPVIDLGAGMTSAMLAWTHYFFSAAFDKINPLVAKRIEYEIDKRVLQPFYARDDFWWMALQKEDAMVNNWNIWVNYNALTCMLLMETDQQKRLAGVYKTMRSADKFINYYKADGGCEEGPSYWSHAGGMLFNYLDLLLQATGGKVNIFGNPLVRNIGNYICKAFITERYYINYADASAKLSPDAGLVYDFGKATGDTLMKSFGSYLATQQNWATQVPGETVESALGNVFQAKEILLGSTEKPFLKEFWLPGTQIMGARDKAGTADGFYFSGLGGHNGESHNHNDVGSCILFYNGQPVLIDIGSGTYTRQTFGAERYSIWTMQSAYHNLPLINGVQQKEGAKYRSINPKFTSAAAAVDFSLDIVGAYPDSANAQEWIRSYRLNRGKSFTITDKYKLNANNGKTALHFMTSNQVEKIKDGLLRLNGNGTTLELKYNAAALTAAVETIEIKDKRLLQSWPPYVYRIVFTIKGLKNTGQNKLVFTVAGQGTGG
ncbi:MAG: heparinase II/III family protein [Chitinophagaceae bacterium]